MDISGDTQLDFGKHKGHTFKEVAQHDPSYCNWVLSLKNTNHIPMLRFKTYLTEGLHKDDGGLHKNENGLHKDDTELRTDESDQDDEYAYLYGGPSPLYWD